MRGAPESLSGNALSVEHSGRGHGGTEMSEITWSVTQCERYTNHEESGNTDVIFNLHWDCVAAEDEHSARVYGSQSLDLSDLSSFTAYADVTESQVIGWLQDSLGDKVESLETNAQTQLDSLLIPPVLKGVPWRYNNGEEEE